MNLTLFYYATFCQHFGKILSTVYLNQYHLVKIVLFGQKSYIDCGYDIGSRFIMKKDKFEICQGKVNFLRFAREKQIFRDLSQQSNFLRFVREKQIFRDLSQKSKFFAIFCGKQQLWAVWQYFLVKSKFHDIVMTAMKWCP